MVMTDEGPARASSQRTPLSANQHVAAVGPDIGPNMAAALISGELYIRGPEKGAKQGCFGSVVKNSKKSEIGVDTRSGRRLYTPHNEGGTPLAALRFAIVSEIKRAA